MKPLFKIAIVLVITSFGLIGCVEEQDPQPYAPNAAQSITKDLKDVNSPRGPIK